MKQALKWIGDALSSKDVVTGKSFYKVEANEIRATDGRLIAGHPWPSDIDFVVPGEEFEAVFKRMKDQPTIKKTEKGIAIRSGLFHGSINTLSLNNWSYPGVEDAVWQEMPTELLPILKALRPFISDNAMQKWATCVALENGWAYATNNVALAGAPCRGLDLMALLPNWAVDFVLSRPVGLTHWAWTPNYVAFRWDNNAWMRASLVVGQFPEKAAAMIRTADQEQLTQSINADFRQAFIDVAEMAEDTIAIYRDRIIARFKQAEVIASVDCRVPTDADCSIWGAAFLLPAIMIAERWSPDSWPRPAPFRGSGICGYVVGRRA